ncbi:unnamed protein product [Sphenostylis stenocarpa]|uniref:Cytochrome P450 n=1 Tax=Sphenostylis stenocarpa TaxID=92480 RepID=A0AA86VD93_9FABA|nr:unnamed protein product [Sphenostylis stenocarpa]
MMRIASGKRYYGEDCDVSDVEEAKQFRDIAEELLMLGGANNPGEFLTLFRLIDFDGLEKRLKRLGQRIDAFLQGLIDEHRKHEGRIPKVDEYPIVEHSFWTMLLAGTNTLVVTLEWSMSNLLNHPEILKKTKVEIDTHIEQNRLVEEADISNLPYLQSIVYKTLRLHPAAPLLVPHLSSEDFIVRQYNVPQNTILLMNAWAIHRDPKLWSDPTQFKPERFKKGSEVNKLLSFGLGRRACPGANLAQRTVSLTLALLIQCFEWKQTSKEEIDMTEGKWVVVGRKLPLEAMCQVWQSPTIKNSSLI